MVNIKSQEKRNRQNQKRALRNKSLKNKIKTLGKRLKAAVEQKDIIKANEELRLYFSALDKAAKVGTVHKNFTANKKSKAAKLINSISSTSTQ